MSTEPINRLLVSTMPLVPKPVIWRFSRRYIAGTTLDDAFDSVKELNQLGCTATMDVLGEDSTTSEQVDAAQQLYDNALAGINARQLDCNISLKLSELGLRMDSTACLETMRAIAGTASKYGNFVRIDMEDSSVTTETLDIYQALRKEFYNVGIVIQSCLHRSEQDVENLLATNTAHVRLCKGIYIEPEEIAYRDRKDIQESFKRLLLQLLEGGAECVGIATHDPALVAHAEATVAKLNVPKDRYEFQMLLGVAGRLRGQLIERGHPLRVYVPFGELWLNYSMRRLRENPHIVGHIIGNLFKR